MLCGLRGRRARRSTPLVCMHACWETSSTSRRVVLSSADSSSKTATACALGSTDSSYAEFTRENSYSYINTFPNKQMDITADSTYQLWNPPVRTRETCAASAGGRWRATRKQRSPCGSVCSNKRSEVRAPSCFHCAPLPRRSTNLAPHARWEFDPSPR